LLADIETVSSAEMETEHNQLNLNDRYASECCSLAVHLIISTGCTLTIINGRSELLKEEKQNHDCFKESLKIKVNDTFYIKFPW
jgi:hypothetical protein